MEGVQARVYSATEVGVVSGDNSVSGNGTRMSLLDSDKKFEKQQLQDQLQKGTTKEETSTTMNIPPQTNPDSLTNASGDFKENKPERDHLQKPAKGQKMNEQQEVREPKNLAGIKTEKQNGSDHDVGVSNGDPTTTRYVLGRGLIMCSEFIQDQVRDDWESNFTDLDLVCSDGFVQVHRCLLMGASPFLRKMLIDKDIMDTTAISLSDVSIRHLKQVLSLLYTGRSVIKKEDEAHVYSLMSMLELPANDLLCRPAKDKDIKRLIDLRHSVPHSDNDSDETQSSHDNGSFADENPDEHEHTEDNQVQKDKNEAEGLLPSAKSLPYSTILEKALTEDCIQERDVQNADLAKNTKNEKASTIGRAKSSDLTVSKTKMIKKRKSVPVETDEDDEKSEVAKEDADDDPKAEIYHRLRKRSKIKIDKPAEILNIKKPVAKPRKKNSKIKATKSSPHEPEVPSISAIKTATQNDSNHEDETKEKDGRTSNGTSTSNTAPSLTTLCPVVPRGRQRRLSTFSSGSSVSSSGTTTESGPSRVFLETKEISGVTYNIYGLLDPIKGVQSGKTIAIMASKDKSRKSDGSSSFQPPENCR